MKIEYRPTTVNAITALAGFILIILLFSGQINGSEDEFFNYECFNSNAATDPTKPIYTAKYKNTVGIQVSNRTTHQLTSRIFAIFLREILGYQNIKFITIQSENLEEDQKLYNTLNRLAAPYGSWPIPTIDLEVWLHPDYHAFPLHISEAGLVTNAGRFGWFYPKQFLQNLQLHNTTNENGFIHYKIFQDPNNNLYRYFVLDVPILNEIQNRFRIQNQFSPEICLQRKCVTLFAECYDDTAFIMKHIKEFNFYVQIIWFGDEYQLVIKYLLNYLIEKKLQNTFILLHWTPSNIIDAEIEYEMISMPKCEEIKSETLCKYELTPLLKFYGTEFSTAIQGLYALEDFEIKKFEMRKLFLDINNEIYLENLTKPNDLIYNRVGCNWLKNNKKIYSEWIDYEPLKLTIGGIFPLSGSTEIAYNDIEKAVKLAVNAVNMNSTILQNFNLALLINDGECRSDIVMKTFIHYFNLITPLLGVLGPACSETVEPIAGISKHTRMAVISYSAEGASFTNRETYPYFFRTIGSNRQYEQVYLQLFKKMKWRRVAALTEDGQKYTEYISHMETLFKQNDMELIINKKFPKEVSANEMKRYLLDLKKKYANIIIADIYNDIAQVVLCEAYHLQMTASHGYVWFLPAWLSKSWVNGKLLNLKHNISCTAEELYEAINGHFSLSHSAFAPNDSIMQENKNVSQWLKDYKAGGNELSDYAGFAYDAVWVYALAADKLIHEDPTAINDLRSPNVLNRFIDIIWKIDFNGLSGRIRFDEGGSRVNDVNILQWINGNSNKIGIYEPIINDIEMKIIDGKLKLNENQIVWLSTNGYPNDGTFVCRLASLAELLNTDCDSVTFILISLMCLFVVILVSLASFMFWKRQYDHKLKQSAKVMRNFGIDLLSPTMNTNNTLDKWEISKEKVVINRRLGEGAFGTVYGGEAQITDNGWTAVAVKTLKAGASQEDRLDFLSEAEAMKRFDHKNIVKLLGVCLQTEPIYTIMEFMLYGDLKTFLLARRHLVNEKITDDSDISPKRLTMMALDVARGLSYLSEQKYVHRDIACRNALVNAQRVVKLGDFGMARPMFDNDYYRFNRKGMLPVRWMAPESLLLSVFTPSSDVWSFGILLYEIITFGSFPYQGLTNNEVLEVIKTGKTIQIPNGTKPHLEGLMRACWNKEYKKRPTASEIVEYISNYPRLITPCLDMPITSVQMPETESDQFELLPRLHKRNTQQPNIDILARTSTINNFDQKSISQTKNSDIKQQTNDIEITNMNLFDTDDNVKTNFQHNLIETSKSTVVPQSIDPIETPTSISNDTNDDSNISSSYSPMAPLLSSNRNNSDSNLSLKRYVPMYSSPLNCINLNCNQTNNSNNLNPNYKHNHYSIVNIKSSISQIDLVNDTNLPTHSVTSL